MGEPHAVVDPHLVGGRLVHRVPLGYRLRGRRRLAVDAVGREDVDVHRVLVHSPVVKVKVELAALLDTTGSTRNSSRTSCRAASTGVSPSSTFPPGPTSFPAPILRCLPRENMHF
jgi:hypothetical protein